MGKLSISMLSGFKWTSFYSIINGLMNGLMLLVLGILLTPGELGNRAVVSLLITAALMFTQFGISQAIIQRQNIKSIDLNSIFILNIFLGLILSLFTYLMADLIASFYSSEALTSFIQLTSLIFIMDSIPLVFKALLEKKLKFQSLALLGIVKVVCATIVTIILAFLGLGVWSFIIGKLVGSVSSIIYFISYSLIKKMWFPKIQFSIHSIFKFLNFGIYVIGTSMINFTSKNLDEILIGRFLGTELLGIYNIAKQAIDQMTQILATSIRKVTYPTFCRIVEGVKEQKSRFSEVYQRLTTIISAIGFPLFVSISFAAPILIYNLLPNSSWSAAVPLIQIFCMKSLLDILSSGFASSALYAHDQPKKVFRVELILLPIRVAFIIISAQISLIAVAMSFLLFVFLKVIVMQNVVNKILRISMKEYLKNISGSTKAILLSTFLTLVANYYFETFYLIQLFLITFTLFITYFVALKYLAKGTFKQLWEIKKIFIRGEANGQ